MFRFFKKVFFVGLTILSSFTNVSSLKCISMNNQECKARPEIINVNSDESVFYPFSIKTSNYRGSPYAAVHIISMIDIQKCV